MQAFFEGILSTLKQETAIVVLAYVAALFIWGGQLPDLVLWISGCVVAVFVVFEKVRAMFWPRKELAEALLE